MTRITKVMKSNHQNGAWKSGSANLSHCVAYSEILRSAATAVQGSECCYLSTLLQFPTVSNDVCEMQHSV